ncbi:CG42322 [Drosophila busckii]|uniref:CG42322 n=1 Tax=Drosophila busckii TaxID=30019 RepID=A0A0M4EUE8_DROBS|nr:CG42322 [Drosophila busckii]
MTRDGEIPAIFNPKRVRTPSVVVTGDSTTNGAFNNNNTGPGIGTVPSSSSSGCGFSNVLTSSNPQITHQDSISSSQQDPNELITIQADTPTGAQLAHFGGDSSDAHTAQLNIEAQPNGGQAGEDAELRFRKLKACKQSCCSELAKKMYFGVCVTILVTASWVGATHCIKYMYLYRTPYDEVLDDELDTSSSRAELSTELEDILAISDSSLHHVEDATEMFNIPPRQPVYFSAPFFAAWFFTNFSLLFFPIYILGLLSARRCDKLSEILADVLRGFRERGFTIGRFLNRCLSFCVLWLVTTYLYTLSLHVLFATDALALFATNVACVYLLSWVILHEQFVGVRIVAVILCDTGIALLAYMDGITESRTLGGVVLATLAAAGYAVFRVMFRKVMGDPPVAQVAFTFTVLGLLNALLLWPVVLALYLTGAENLSAESIPWNILLAASVLLLGNITYSIFMSAHVKSLCLAVFHVLMQFSAAVTYNMFVTLGLITAVPVSGALDVILYSATFAGMKLAGVILIAIGFFLVMFPENWPDYITRLLRRRGSGGLRAPPTGTGRLFSYFGNEHEHEPDRKKSETSFFNLGFRRKSTVVYYAPQD